MDWTAGYASDVEYTAGFYNEQSPAHLNFACVLNGVEPVDTSKPYTYCELGFGRGLTINVLAAANPLGSFYAADFNPAHVAGARQLASKAQLDNLTLLDNSFEELARGDVVDLPLFDFITLHGIYTWVTKDNQRHIARFIKRYLKPGGIVYLSYNAMPGWSASIPLQRIIVDHANLNPGSSTSQIKAAAQFLDELVNTDKGYFANNDAIRERLDSLHTASPSRLVYEYMHRHWKPMYHADMVGDLAESRLDYVGSAELVMAFPPLYLRPEYLALVESIQDAKFRETVKDCLLNTEFRKDVFVRGARRITESKRLAWMRKTGLVLTSAASPVLPTIRVSNTQVSAEPELYDPLISALSKGPLEFEQICALPGLAARHPNAIIQLITLMVAAGTASVYIQQDGAIEASRTRLLNHAIADLAEHTDDYQCLASALTGSGFYVDLIDRFFIAGITGGLAEEDADGLAEHAWRMLRAQGRLLQNDGEPVTTEEENLDYLTQMAREAVQGMLPRLRTLGAI
jgi:SAM-dependent methyltransferase